MGRMGRRVMVVVAWVLSTVLAAGVAWAAVGAVGRGPGQGDEVLTASQVADALAARRAAAASAGPTTSPGTSTPDPTGEPTTAPTGTPSSSPTSSPTTAPTAPDVVARAWSVAGGSVVATCTGAAIALTSATADDGWAYEVKHAGPEQVEVEFKADGDAETRLHAACVGGVPEMTVESSTESHDDEDRSRDGGGGDD